MFNKYQKKKDDSKVLLLYLLLNGNDTEKIKMIEEVEDSRRKVIYGVTSEVVNGRQFEQEIEKIQSLIICSPQSYELYSNSRLIHIYTPKEGNEICINDMAVISRVMVIEENCIVSSNAIEAKSPEDIEHLGFMYFYEYVRTGKMIIGKWKAVYENDNGLFQICYNPDGYPVEKDEKEIKQDSENTEVEESEQDNETQEKSEEKKKGIELVLFSSVEIDRTATYKFVIYIITKLRDEIYNNIGCRQNNFRITDYELVVND